MLSPILIGKKASQILMYTPRFNLFNEILTNIFTNFVPNKLITVDGKDPPWVTEIIKKLLQTKVNCLNNTSKVEERKNEKLFNMTTNIATEISNSKKYYLDNLAEKLFDQELDRKAYCSIPKSSTNLEKK